MMKKLKAILGGKLDRAVLAAKEKRINAQLQLAKVNKEEELEAAKNQVETLYTKLGNKDLPSEESKEISKISLKLSSRLLTHKKL